DVLPCGGAGGGAGGFAGAGPRIAAAGGRELGRGTVGAMSLYTVRIFQSRTDALDGVTPLVVPKSQVIQSKAGDRAVTVSIAGPFGIFDPGQFTGQDGQIFSVISLSVIADAVPVYSPGSEVRIQSAPSAGAVTREQQIINLAGNPGVFPSLSKIFPVGHKLVFDTLAEGNASGPYMVQIALCSLEPLTCAQVAAQLSCCDAGSTCCTPVVLPGIFGRGIGDEGFPMLIDEGEATQNIRLPGCNLTGATVSVARSTLGISVGTLPTINGVVITPTAGDLPEVIDIDIDTTGTTEDDNFLLIVTAPCGCCESCRGG
ncbi:hypothetical protein LCGC14_2175790, partial [marine sediment metagenome]